jgi:single-strand DNA-binding protein
MNNICINATLVRDPELAYAQSGKAWVAFSVAYNHTKTESSFFDCKAFDKTAEMIGKFFGKGDGINLMGELKQESWEKDGQKRSKTVIIVRNVSFPRGKKGGGEGGGERQPARQDSSARAVAYDEPADDFDDMEVPF